MSFGRQYKGASNQRPFLDKENVRKPTPRMVVLYLLAEQQKKYQTTIQKVMGLTGFALQKNVKDLLRRGYVYEQLYLAIDMALEVCEDRPFSFKLVRELLEKYYAE